MKVSDQEILSAIVQGDPRGVVGSLYNQEFPKLERFILRNSGSKEDAKDVFQEALMALFTHVKLGKFDCRYEIGAFLYVVACNRWRKRNKNKQEFMGVEESSLTTYSENSTYEAVFSSDTKEVVRNLFDQIGENCKKILQLSVFNNYSLKEIAAELGYDSEDTVKTRRYKCKMKLMQIIKENPNYAAFLKETLTKDEH